MTKRIVVAREGINEFGYTIEKGALVPSDKSETPVVAWFNFDRPPIGRACGFERNDETGEISYDVTMYDAYHEELMEQFGGTIYASNVERDHLTVSAGTIRAISIAPATPAFPQQTKEQ